MKRYIEKEYYFEFLDPRWWIQIYWFSRQFLKFQLSSERNIFAWVAGYVILYSSYLTMLFAFLCYEGMFGKAYTNLFIIGAGFFLACTYKMMSDYSMSRLYARTDYRKQKLWKEQLAFKRWLRKKYAT